MEKAPSYRSYIGSPRLHSLWLFCACVVLWSLSILILSLSVVILCLFAAVLLLLVVVLCVSVFSLIHETEVTLKALGPWSAKL